MRKQTLESVEASLKRWRTRLKRAMTAIDKLERQRKRLEAKPVTLTENIGSTTWSKPKTTVADIDPPPPIDDLAIPTFLRRDKEPDPVAVQIATEQADLKKRKARGRIEKMKAKQRGDLKKMPLTGRAALEAIRNG